MASDTNKKKTRIFILLLFLCTSLFVALLLFINYRNLTDLNPELSTQLTSRNYHALYAMYAVSEPDITYTIPYGKGDAAITLIAYLDPMSESTQTFLTNIFPGIENDFITPGIVAYHQKHFIFFQDIQEKSQRFQRAALLSCVGRIAPAASHNLTMELLRENPTKPWKPELSKHNIDKDAVATCIRDGPFDDLFQDAIETENFGGGISPRFYIGYRGTGNAVIAGIPTYKRFSDTLKMYSFEIGA